MTFRQQLDAAYKKKVEGLMQRRQRATAMEVFASLIALTPVDTGRAKSNWWMDVNVIATALLEPDNAAGATQQAVTVGSSKIEMDDTIYISNNLPYINRLNDGHSKQAPAGFVESSVQIGSARGKEAAGGME